jgi:hypothetical protein
LFIRVDEFDDDGTYRVVAPEGPHLIVGHSESGHHHVIEMERSPNAQHLINETNAFLGRLILEENAEVKHLRSFDTHAPVNLPAGKYQVRWRAEHTPEGMRRVMD